MFPKNSMFTRAELVDAIYDTALSVDETKETIRLSFGASASGEFLCGEQGTQDGLHGG